MGKCSFNGSGRESLLSGPWSMSIVVQEKLEPLFLSLGLLVDKVETSVT
jgi:hypothetical protein